ncbi:MAG: radical SAM family heme chaperone HemW [Pseudomonadota bacterium]
MRNVAKPKEFGIYIHWPFCAAKCPYCDFNSHVRHNGVDQDMFLDAYKQETAHMASLVPGRTVSSIFFGGGTPSLMDVATVEELLNTIANHWNIDQDVEITLEANPSSVDASRFAGYQSAGINRVSLGVQSLIDTELKFLGRLHTAEEAIRAIEIAQNNFQRMSFDMIYARPGQSLASWEKELNIAIGLAADHLSLYQLTIEQGTPFFGLHEAGKFQIPEEDCAADLYELTSAITADAGFSNYEISNYAKPGHECRHNLIYWRGQEYAGIGPGAHGRLQTNRGRLATATIRNPEEWWQKAMSSGDGLDDEIYLDPEEHADEFLLMGLRLAEGFDPRAYEEICGRAVLEEKILFLEQLGMLETLPSGKIRATNKGFLVLDAVVADLASEPSLFDLRSFDIKPE